MKSFLHHVLHTVWGCVYPGCGATFDTYVALAAHVGSHYS